MRGVGGDSCVSESWEGAGDGKGLVNGKVDVVDVDVKDGCAVVVVVVVGLERAIGNPWAAKALITASQPFSRVLIRSFNSSFSRSALSFSSSPRTVTIVVKEDG